MRLDYLKTVLKSLVFFAMFAPGVLMATQTENRGVHAVPAPKPVVIDGNIDDWDLSGQYLQSYLYHL
jgi:hypothetical protein